MQRESMEYDVLVIGGGPCGLSAAIRLRQLAMDSGEEISVCVLEKGSEIGAHILSGAIFEPRALHELLPDWRDRGAPLDIAVGRDEVYFFKDQQRAIRIPDFLVPRPMHNAGNYIISLGNLCRWLAQQGEELGVDIFPGFPAADVIIDEHDRIQGVITGDMGLSADGSHKDSYQPGMELRAKYTIFAEGCRGHLGKRLIAHYRLDADRDPQHYALGIKELWDIDPARHVPGLVLHGAGWPLSESASNGGSFLYHLNDNQISIGLITDLNYSNPYLSPFEEFQRFKHHPLIHDFLAGGRRIAYGARAISKGGLFSQPRMVIPGALLAGCEAGTLNFAKIKGIHTAMKSGSLAAESIHQALTEASSVDALDAGGHEQRYRQSWLYDELYRSRNFGSAIHRFGLYAGSAYNLADQNLFAGALPVSIHDRICDHETLQPADKCRKIVYPKPDGTISFDRLSSVFLSNTNHEEDQPCHLHLRDPEAPIKTNLDRYDAPEQRYCPAGVYEIVAGDAGKPKLQINSQNCLHCKACDIKDPLQNINWVTPEGGGGPNYPNM